MPNDIQLAVGRTIRENRRKAGMTLAVVSERTGVSVSYLSEVERGMKNVSSECIVLLCRALSIEEWSFFRQVSAAILADARGRRRP